MNPIKIAIYSVTPNVEFDQQNHVRITLEDFLRNFIQVVYVEYNDKRYIANIMSEYTEIPKKIKLNIYETEFTFF